jgi:hypothetical protein
MNKILNISLACLIFSPGLSASLVQNGDFETPQVGPTWQVFYVAPDGFEWVISPASIDIVRLWQPASGYQSLDLDGNFPGGGGVYQDVATIPGQTYTGTSRGDHRPRHQDTRARGEIKSFVF